MSKILVLSMILPKIVKKKMGKKCENFYFVAPIMNKNIFKMHKGTGLNKTNSRFYSKTSNQQEIHS